MLGTILKSLGIKDRKKRKLKVELDVVVENSQETDKSVGIFRKLCNKQENKKTASVAAPAEQKVKLKTMNSYYPYICCYYHNISAVVHSGLRVLVDSGNLDANFELNPLFNQGN